MDTSTIEVMEWIKFHGGKAIRINSFDDPELSVSLTLSNNDFSGSIKIDGYSVPTGFFSFISKLFQENYAINPKKTLFQLVFSHNEIRPKIMYDLKIVDKDGFQGYLVPSNFLN